MTDSRSNGQELAMVSIDQGRIGASTSKAGYCNTFHNVENENNHTLPKSIIRNFQANEI
ncbi:MAG: hypothetical protein ACU841_09465 [Gammaproteobacteria bacterium]